MLLYQSLSMVSSRILKSLGFIFSTYRTMNLALILPVSIMECMALSKVFIFGDSTY